MNPIRAIDRLFYAVFGQTRNVDLMVMLPAEKHPDWTKVLFKIVFGVYMLVTVVVLVKLLIATMSDTYQQIQAQSDIEWKFGLSKLIRNIHRTTTAPSPINLITTWFFYIKNIIVQKAYVIVIICTGFFHSIFEPQNLPSLLKNPIEVFELLFFAVFGQTSTEQLQTKTDTESVWVDSLFKMVFGAYMLVSVVVLINLLIAMMTDTYQRIQAQSDIEWKFGLSKLVRSMHRTSTAPSPINLFTTWFLLLFDFCKTKFAKKDRPDLIRMISTLQGKQLSPRTKAAEKWLSKIKRKRKIAPQEVISKKIMHLHSPVGSQMEFIMHTTRLDYVTDWDLVAKKYRNLMGYTEHI